MNNKITLWIAFFMIEKVYSLVDSLHLIKQFTYSFACIW